MRTLNRPMFNMGGPIKEGVMHGIREPYRGGGAALVGNPVYPQTGGREHHNIWRAGGQLATRGIKAFSNIFGKRVPVTHTPIRQVPITGTTPSSLHRGYPGSVGGGTKFVKEGPEVTKQIFEPNPFGKYLASSPEVAIAKKLYEGKGLITKPIKMAAKSPLLTAAGAIWAGDRWLWGDGKEVSDKDIAKITGGQHGPFDHTKAEKKLTKKAQAAFAEAQRDTRVKKYLDMMGYDRSKKTAVADALIDASKIVSDRGTLEKKNITRDLINPIIQATSKRFDKPEQIREAVGLMTMKAEIEKDVSKEKDALAKSLTMKRIEQLDRQLDSGVAGKLLTYMAAKKGKVKGDELVDFVRLSANEEGKNFTMVTDEQVQAVPGWEDKSAEEVISFIAKEDGVYMMGDTVIEVEGGKPTRIK